MIQREGRKKKGEKKQPVASHGTAEGGEGAGDVRGHGRLSFPLALHEHMHISLSDRGFLKRSEDGRTLAFVRSP